MTSQSVKKDSGFLYFWKGLGVIAAIGLAVVAVFSLLVEPNLPKVVDSVLVGKDIIPEYTTIIPVGKVMMPVHHAAQYELVFQDKLSNGGTPSQRHG